MDYTIKELSKLAGIPESTARYYRDRHPEYFYHTGTGRKKRYTAETLDVLRFILRLAQDRRNAEEIAEAIE
jgi:DNA-binding transcriptional MerR regulator